MSTDNNDNDIDIDVFGIIGFFWKRKALIFLTAITFPVLALVASTFRPSNYEATIVLDIGRNYNPEGSRIELAEAVGTMETLLTSDLTLIRLKKELEYRGHFRLLIRNLKIHGNIRNIEVLPELLLNISVTMADSGKALLFANFLAKNIIDLHAPFYQLSLDNMALSIENTNYSINKNENLINTLKFR